MKAPHLDNLIFLATHTDGVGVWVLFGSGDKRRNVQFKCVDSTMRLLDGDHRE